MLRQTTIESGKVAGLIGTDARITVYRGIPFAADTSGKNRWRPPQPVEPWEGVRKCYEFGQVSTQKTPGADPNAFYSKEWHVDPEVDLGENCLCANVWTPAKSADEKLPVMIWIYGGGLQEGYAHEMEYDGERIASRGVILVSIGYRVNVFGFLCHPEITKESPEAPANFGLLDQKAGFEWVKRNIAAFGGDPENITIFGQSAGGGSTMYHLTSPQSAGLFQKAIAQSPGGPAPVYPKAFMPLAVDFKEAEAAGERFVRDILGCSSLEEARKLDNRYIEQKCQEFKPEFMFTATVDGKFILDQWYQRVLDDKVNDVQLMTGNTTGEFLFGPGPEDDPVQWIQAQYGPYADRFIEICRKTAGDDAAQLRKAATVVGFELEANLTAEIMAAHGRPVYYYHFGPTVPGDNAGPFHSCELWFMFETIIRSWRPWNGNAFDLARKMCNYWTNFAKTGDPNGPDHGEPMPVWKKYTSDEKNVIRFLDEIETAQAPVGEKMKFLVDINLKEYKY